MSRAQKEGQPTDKLNSLILFKGVEKYSKYEIFYFLFFITIF